MEEFVFTWKVENFSVCVNKKGNFVSSPTFVVDSLDKTAWFLQIYPYGDGDETCVACYLNRSDSDGEKGNIVISFTISFVMADGSEKLLKTFEDQSFSLSQRIGCKDLKRLDDILKEKKTILPRDTMTIRCYMMRSTATPSTSKNKDVVKTFVNYLFGEKADTPATDLPPEMYTSADGVLKEIKGKLSPYPDNCIARTKVRVERRSFTWHVENFSELQKKQKVSMPMISASRLTPSLMLTFYLDDESIADQHIQIEIRKKPTFTSAGIIAKCNISVLNDRGKPCEFNGGTYFFDAQKKDEVWQFPPLIKKSKLVSEKSVYLQNDTLSLLFEFTFSDGTTLSQVEETTYSSEDIPDTEKSFDSLMSLKKDLHNLSNETALCDVTLLVGKEKTAAHKAVLSARSPVFKAMFERDMTEKNSGVVKIPDMDSEILTKMLDFMYGGIIGDLQYESAAKLYSAADKYQCLSLKDECASLLKASLSVANVCDVLVLADMHQDEDLKMAGRDFILRHGAETLRSEEWKTLMKNRIQLAVETLHHVGLVYMEA